LTQKSMHRLRVSMDIIVCAVMRLNAQTMEYQKAQTMKLCPVVSTCVGDTLRCRKTLNRVANK